MQGTSKSPQGLLGRLIRRAKRRPGGFDFLALLRFCREFGAYSLHNRALIWMQNPKATFVAGRRRWEEDLGRRIRAGERPIEVLVPSGGGRSFARAEVYDVSQTSGETILPRERRPIDPGDEERQVSQLIAFARSLEIGVRVEASCALEAGRVSGANVREIVLSANLSRQAQLATLLHELSHFLLGHLGSVAARGAPDRRSLPKNIQELEAESVAFLAAETARLETFAARYAALWKREHSGLIAECLVISVASRLRRVIGRALQSPAGPPAARAA